MNINKMKYDMKKTSAVMIVMISNDHVSHFSSGSGADILTWAPRSNLTTAQMGSTALGGPFKHSQCDEEECQSTV